MRNPRIWPAHMWPCASSASTAYSSSDFMARLEHPQSVGRELHHPISIILLLLEFLAGHVDGHLARELEPDRLWLFGHAQQLRRDLIRPGPRAVMPHRAQLFGPNAQPDAIAQKPSGKIRPGDFVI